MYDFTNEWDVDCIYVRMLVPKVAICSYNHNELMILLDNFHDKTYDISFFRYDYFNRDHYYDFIELASHKEFMDQIDEIIFYFPEDTYRIAKDDFVNFVAEKHVECFL